ncbi:hypothetical protein B0H16DRAFT_1412808 [Mycena metata]|uniref:Uncharacterized protein n=1 Tax=Mycena metata TaxID=1033252 RepID=A0AAD7NLJ1_9AGAR|nr:hypothetical protein B0H16DRAFT_1412808 [Mycena metata]
MNAFLLDSIASRFNDSDFYNLHLPQYAYVVEKNATIILLAFAAFIILLALIFPFSSSSHPPDKPSDAVEALLTVLSPTYAAWPKDYAHLVAHNTSPRSRTLSISMDSLISKVYDGTLEVRNYADLPDLFSEHLVVYGWRISLALETSWNLEVLRWSIGSHFSWRTPSAEPRRALKRAHGTSKPKDESPLSFSLTPNTHLDLDYTPFSAFESSLLELRTTLAPGTSATLEFTAPAAHLTFLSTHFTLCAVPLLPRRHCITRTTPTRTRTTTPLLGSLHRVLELLTAGPAALALESVLNVSRKYADGLNAAALHLEEDRAARTAFVHQWGVAGWREQRLMMAWEAALFSAEHLTRWIVVVRK